MDTAQKLQEGLEQVSKENFYKPLETPIISSTAAKVGNIVKTLFDNEHIDDMTYKWLSSGQNHREYQNFTRWPKYTKTLLSADQLFLVAVAQQNASPVLLTPFYNRSLKNKSPISKTLPTLSTSMKTLHLVYIVPIKVAGLGYLKHGQR